LFFATKLARARLAMPRGRTASAGDCWRRRYEGVERMTLATSREKSAGFRRICPELSAFESVDCAGGGGPARVLQKDLQKEMQNEIRRNSRRIAGI
jgi:hypothetical protein